MKQNPNLITIITKIYSMNLNLRFKGFMFLENDQNWAKQKNSDAKFHI